MGQAEYVRGGITHRRAWSKEAICAGTKAVSASGTVSIGTATAGGKTLIFARSASLISHTQPRQAQQKEVICNASQHRDEHTFGNNISRGWVVVCPFDFPRRFQFKFKLTLKLKSARGWIVVCHSLLPRDFAPGGVGEVRTYAPPPSFMPVFIFC